ncbi:MAG: O-antigen polymerase [Candidatus Helarchaeota archaeon]
MIVVFVIIWLILIRLGFTKILPLKLFSISGFNLAGVIFFIGLGFAFKHDYPPLKIILIITVFYTFLIIGELLGKYFKFDIKRYRKIGEKINLIKSIRLVLLIIFIFYCLLPFFEIITSGESIKDRILDTWMSYGVTERAQRLKEHHYGQQELSGISAFTRAFQRQIPSFWYLSIGVIFINFPRFTYIFLLANAFGIFITSGGARSPIIIALLIPLLLFFMSLKKKKLLFFVIPIVVIVVFLLLNFLLYGRQGRTSTVEFSNIIAETIQTDFAYGGRALDFTSELLIGNFERGLYYIKHLIVFMIPRFLYPSKPIVDPNWEMTEAYFNLSLWMRGSITLFTPLAEAFYFFGYIGLLIIPFFYGFTTAFLERLYSSSKSYIGLLTQVYIWAFLGMRHTYWNVFGSLIIGNFLILFLIFSVKFLKYNSIFKYKKKIKIKSFNLYG